MYWIIGFTGCTKLQEDFKMTAGGAWRRPQMKVYDYNQEFGGNYYQPMIQYINHKDIYGPFSKKADVYLPHSAEGGASRPGGGQPLHQRALHRQDRQPQARHQVSSTLPWSRLVRMSMIITTSFLGKVPWT